MEWGMKKMWTVKNNDKGLNVCMTCTYSCELLCKWSADTTQEVTEEDSVLSLMLLCKDNDWYVCCGKMRKHISKLYILHNI